MTTEIRKEGWFDRHKILGTILIIMGSIILVLILIGIFVPQETTKKNSGLKMINPDENSISSSSDYANPSSAISELTEEEKQEEILKTATHASVSSFAENWDADAEEDGIIIYPDLRNSNDETVKFNNIELGVDIEIWTTKYNEDFQEVKDRKVYSGDGKIDSWKDGNMFMDGGIKVPFDDIKTVGSDRDYGLLIIKIHTNTKTFEAKDEFARIKQD